MTRLHQPALRAPVLAGVGVAVAAAALSGCDARSDPAPASQRAFEIEADGAATLRVGSERFRVRTQSVARGGIPLAEPIDELVEPVGRGFEQRWLFAAAPEGEGDLVVRVGFDDLRFVGTAACGARYRSVETNNGICYGRATWIDAAGERTAIPWSIDARGIGMRVPAEVLQASRYPARLDPVVSPELEIADFALGPKLGPGFPWGTARGTDVVGVVMETHRDDGAAQEFALLDLAGNLLTEPGILLTEQPAGVPFGSSDIAFDGTVFRAFGARFSGIYLYRIASDGEVLDPGGVLVADVPAERLEASCDSDGRCLLAYSTDQPSILRVSRVSPDGVLLATTPPLAGTWETGPFERTDTGGRLALSRTLSQRGIATFPDDLSTLDLQLVGPGAMFGLQSLVREDGSRWVASCDGGAVEVDDAYIPVDGPAPPGECGWSPIIETPEGMVVDTGSSLEILDEGGAVVASIEGPGESPLWHLVPLTDDTVLRVSNQGSVAAPPAVDVVSRRFDLATLTVGPPQVLSLDRATTVLGDAASHDGGFAVSFRDYRLGWDEPRERLRFFDRDGTATDPGSLDLGPGGVNDARSHVAFNGETFMVLWPDYGAGSLTFRVRRFSPEGASLDASPFVVPIPPGYNGVELAAREDDFVILFASNDSLSALEFPDASPLVATPLALPDAGMYSVTSALKGDELWIVSPDAGDAVRLTRYDGASATTVPVAAYLEGVACNEDRCLALAFPSSVAELNADGTLVPGVELTEIEGGAVEGYPRSLAWDGTAFVVAYTLYDEPADGFRTAAVWVNESGQQVLAGPVTLSDPSTTPGLLVRVAALDEGRSLVIGEEMSLDYFYPRFMHAHLLDSEIIGEGGAGGATNGAGGDGTGGASGAIAVSASSSGGGELGGAGGSTAASGLAGQGGGGGSPATTGTGGGGSSSAAESGSGGAGIGAGGAATSTTSGLASSASSAAPSASASASSTGSTTSAPSTSDGAGSGGDGVAEGGGCSCNLLGATPTGAAGWSSLALAASALTRRRRERCPSRRS